MSKLFIQLVLVIPILVRAQSGDTVFTVKAVASSVKLFPETDFLYKDITKKFSIVKSPSVKIDTIIFTEGNVIVKDSLLFIKPSKSKTALLKIYVNKSDGKPSLAFVKEFEVRKFIEPRANIDGVENDSAIQRMRVVAMGYVNVPINREPELKRISYKIIAFEMQQFTNGVADTLRTSGSRMSFDMRDRIDKMQDGSVIEIRNIKYLMNEDTLTIQNPLRVYLLNDKVSKF